MTYITTTEVSNELNGLEITASTIPSTDTVNEWIAQESDILNKETGKVWGSITATDEYLDYDGSGYLRLKHSPIISITSFYNEQNGLNADEESWVLLTEGRKNTDSFITYKQDGELEFHGVLPVAGNLNCRVTYVYGQETTNSTVKAIIAKRVALRVINAVVNSQSSEEGGQITVDVISISDPSTFSLQRILSLKNDINDLTKSLGTFKVYRYTRK